MTDTARIGWLEAFDARYLRMPSTLALIAANLVPVYGVLFWGWDLFGLMVLYWVETAIIGGFAILQMAIAARWRALLLVPFFIVHFGGFMAGHMFFLALFFARDRLDGFGDIPALVSRTITHERLWIAVGALFASHLVSFLLNVLWPMLSRSMPAAPRAAPDEQGAPQDVMGATYGRVIILHVTILFGAFLTSVFASQMAAFLLLIALKTAVDIAAHVRRNVRPRAVVP